MSRLEFDGMKHEITLYNSKEEIVGTWEAQNNIDHIVKDMRHLPDKSYIVQDQHSPHRHNTPGVDTADGEYGTCGIVRFYTPKTPYNEKHEGVGVHAGREHYYRRPGPQHPTKGCIRTTEEAMKAITKLMQSDALQTVTVKNNMFKGKK
ncbi:hypothetical protein [Zymobacter sp. IVIA_12111.31 C1]|uniref:hypothetical protein n=1 Tax=Zymobacter sp. IVIA_12111.31 C1 TaxID=3394854 RepID=UPI0039C41FE7